MSLSTTPSDRVISIAAVKKYLCWCAQGGGTDPWETGSYDLALEEAHIEDFNIGGCRH